MRIRTRLPRIQHCHPGARYHLHLIPINRSRLLLALLKQLSKQRRYVGDTVIGGLASDFGICKLAPFGWEFGIDRDDRDEMWVIGAKVETMTYT